MFAVSSVRLFLPEVGTMCMSLLSLIPASGSRQHKKGSCSSAGWPTGELLGEQVSAGLVPGLHRVPGKKQGRERAWPLVSSQPGALFLWETWEGEAQAVLGRLDVSCLPSLRARALAGTCACMEVVGSGQGLLWDRHR